jgi:hypothetical protein
MRLFHISDVLSVTTGRLVSTRHIDGVYDILNFLTSDNIFIHQLPRAYREAEPWLRQQFPQLFPDNPITARLMEEMDARLRDFPYETKDQRQAYITEWIAAAQLAHALPEMLPVYEMGEDMHTHIDPIEEACAMVGDGKVIVVENA